MFIMICRPESSGESVLPGKANLTAKAKAKQAKKEKKVKMH